MNKSLSKSSYMILGIISKGPISGYGIKQIIHKIATFYWSESNSQIYPTLSKLTNEKLLISKLDAASGKRKKKIYTITEKGLKALKSWLNNLSEPTPYREELLLKFSLGHHITKIQMIKHLENYQSSLATQLEYFDVVINHIKTDHAKREDLPYLLMVYEHVHDILLAKSNWCQKQLKIVR